MAGIVKHVVRFGVIGGIATVAAVAIAGPDRMGALFTQSRETINNRIDARITDPVALRAQLRSLEAEYPKRITQVRGDLAELREQMSQLRRDLEISQRVVTMADDDRQTLAAAIERAHEARAEGIALVSNGPAGQPADVVIVFKNDRLDVEGASARLDQAAATRHAYATRAVDIQKNLDLLGKQENRLSALLSKLEGERVAFQSQLWTIDQEVDAIARNERMIATVSRWQETVDEGSRYRANNLDQLRARLADVRARQESKLEYMAASHAQSSYEAQAKAELDRAAASGHRQGPQAQPTRRVLEINASELRQAPSTPTPLVPAANSIVIDTNR